MKPRCVVKKSVFPELNFWLILFSWLIVPLIIQIVKIVFAKCYTLKFYDDRVVVVEGLFDKKEKHTIFSGVYAISMYRSFWGRVFNYGDIKIDCPGVWDIDTRGIVNPKKLKRYLETRIITGGMTNVIYN